MECVQSAHYSILVNGSPMGFFTASRGPRQGDPFSPFVFVIVGEALSRMIVTTASGNRFKGFRTSMNGPTVSHLQFAYDMLIFCDVDEDEIKNVKATMLCFEAVSGLKINFFKSELIGFRVPERPLQALEGLMGCKAPTTYLGLPLCIGAPPKLLWFPVVERLEKRLALWKANYLSLGGRITLIKSVLSNLPLYFL